MRKLPVLGTAREAAPLSAERLFREQFLPLYPPGADLAALRSTDANPAQNPAIFEAIQETSDVFAKLAPVALEASDLVLDRSDASIHKLSALLTREARDRLFAERSTPGEPPLLIHFMIHGAIYVATTIVATRGAEWLVRSPLWETRVRLVSHAGDAELSPFSWWLRSLADDGLGRVTLADRYRSLVEVPTLDASSWPVLAEPSRRLPRLGRVRYDLLYQHLRRHVEELRDFGQDFPPPQRFEELRFDWLAFDLVGDGRALLVHGPGKGGLHLFWLTASGFLKSLFVEADKSPEHRVERGRTADGVETIRLSFSRGGEPIVQELLWWGP